MPYTGRVCDRFGDWGSFDGQVSQITVHRERARALPVHIPPPPEVPLQKSDSPEAAGPAFKPPRKKGGAFNKVPEYIEDPLDLKIAAARERAKERIAKSTSMSSKAFKPTGCDLDYRMSKETGGPAFASKATTSIMFHSRNL